VELPSSPLSRSHVPIIVFSYLSGTSPMSPIHSSQFISPILMFNYNLPLITGAHSVQECPPFMGKFPDAQFSFCPKIFQPARWLPTLHSPEITRKFDAGPPSPPVFGYLTVGALSRPKAFNPSGPGIIQEPPHPPVCIAPLVVFFFRSLGNEKAFPRLAR